MRLLSLTLEQFRSYPALTLDLTGSENHVFLGPNGSGKTNILEAVAFLSAVESCLPVEESDLLHWGTDFLRVEGRMSSDTGEESVIRVIAVLSPRRQKGCFVNDVRVPAGTMVGTLPTVLFLPGMLSLFSGPPAERRRFLDHVLAQVRPEYAQSLREYQKLLKQRNALLSRIADGGASPEDLDPWDQRLAECGALLTALRLELVSTMNLTVRQELLALGEACRAASFHYERKSRETTESALAEELGSLLRSARDRDVLLQATTVGPHREDWTLLLDGRRIETFASRGQQRTAVLALLFLEVSYVGLRRGERPIILLDDVFSELDDLHAHAVLRAFSDHQVLITATHLPPEIASARVWEVENGHVYSAIGEHARKNEAGVRVSRPVRVGRRTRAAR